MSLDADLILDRRRLKRRLTIWQVIAVGVAILAVLAAIGRFGDFGGKPTVARLSVTGVIEDDPRRDAALAEIARDDRVRALIVRIDSPGGTVVGGESLYRTLRQVAESKPVAAVMGQLATSAGYMVAMGADHIVARESTITGSIGVILQAADVTEMLESLGIEPVAVKSSPLKAQPNPLEPFTPEAEAATRAVVLDIYEMFVSMVEQRRGMSHSEALTLADGRIYTGRQAAAKGLIDAIGGEDEARQWLDETHNIAPSVPTTDIDVRDPEERWRDMFSGFLRKTPVFERLTLDGLVSLWHPVQ